jgi:hypothetical protein
MRLSDLAPDRMIVLEERMTDGKQGTSSGKPAIESSVDKQRERAPASASKPTPSHPETPDEKQTDSIYDHFDKSSFRFWEREISKGHLPTSTELTELLKKNRGSPVPHWLVPIIERRDELRWRTGRPRKSVLNEMQLSLASARYSRYLAWLQARHRRLGLQGWPAIRNKDWWTGPPHERAARMALRRAKLSHMTWRTFLNGVVNYNTPTYYE